MFLARWSDMGCIYFERRAIMIEQQERMWKYIVFELSNMSHLSAIQCGEMMTMGDINMLFIWKRGVLYAQK
jgi:hypothetical protein